MDVQRLKTYNRTRISVLCLRWLVYTCLYTVYTWWFCDAIQRQKHSLLGYHFEKIATKIATRNLWRRRRVSSRKHPSIKKTSAWRVHTKEEFYYSNFLV